MANTRDLEELSKDLHLIITPSSLWALHTHPQHHYIAALHVQIKLFSRVYVDKGVIITFNDANNTMSASFLIQNSFVKIPSVNNCVKDIADLTHLIYFVHNLQICPNSELTTQHPLCAKYVLEPSESFCHYCLSQDTKEEIELLWKNFETGSTKLNTLRSVKSDVHLCDNCYTDNCTEHCCEEIFTCEYCNKHFLSQLYLEKHLEIHNEEGNFACNVCGEQSRSYILHYQHMAIHSNRSKRRRLNNSYNHSDERQFLCDICNKGFEKLYKLKVHEKIHTGERPYVCITCEKTYTTQSNLATHVRSTHTKQKPYCCAFCSMSFIYPHHLKIHMRKHTGERPYKCNICTKTFAKNIHLTVHMRTHTGEKPHICNICHKGFTTTGNLSAHNKVYHTKTIKSENV